MKTLSYTKIIHLKNNSFEKSFKIEKIGMNEKLVKNDFLKTI